MWTSDRVAHEDLKVGKVTKDPQGPQEPKVTKDQAVGRAHKEILALMAHKAQWGLRERMVERVNKDLLVLLGLVAFMVGTALMAMMALVYAMLKLTLMAI